MVRELKLGGERVDGGVGLAGAPGRRTVNACRVGAICSLWVTAGSGRDEVTAKSGA